ncbi:MAG TPA: hypothetical protein VN673_16500, partial [Clostridia bacterium]|nr:hypothetical protein [Clostridia bacterium]
MNAKPGAKDKLSSSIAPPRARGCLKPAKWGCGCLVVVFVGIAAAVFSLLNQVPKSYPPVAHPIPPPSVPSALGTGLDGFDSPYLGHTGSWDGKGGALGGGMKTGDLDIEAAMG